MKKILLTATLAGLLGALAISSLASAAMVGIYRNGLDTLSQRSQLVKVTGRDCARGGAGEALRIAVGKRTESCALRTPVLGKDLEIAATMRLLSGTPRAVQRKAFLGVQLRAGAGARYELRVFPLQRKTQLIKFTREGSKYLQIAKNLPTVMGVNKANALRLRAMKVREPGPDRGKVVLTGFLGREPVVEGIDTAPKEVTGQASTVVVGAPRNGSGVVASVDNVIIRVPSPF